MLKSKSSAFIVAVVFAMASGAAHASGAQFMNQLTADETGRQLDTATMSMDELNRRYNQHNTSGDSSAYGRYQMIVSHFQKAGLVERIDGSTENAWDWDMVRITDEARQQGINSLDALGTTRAGHAAQDRIASELARSMWNELSPSRSALGTTVNAVHNGRPVQVTVNESAMLGSTWFLGSGDMNEWAQGGFSLEALRNHSRLSQIMSANPAYPTVEALHGYLVNRMGKYTEIDISEITNGQYTPGSFEYASEEVLVCDPEINEYLLSKAEQHVKDVVAAAQDEQLGYSQLGEGEEFGEMSCIDSIFTGSLDVLFNVPNLADLGQMAVQAVCSQTNKLVAQANAGIGEKMNELTSAASLGGAGKGFISNYGVQTNWNRQGAGGVNVDVAGGNFKQTNALDIANYSKSGGPGAGATYERMKRPGAYSSLFK